MEDQKQSSQILPLSLRPRSLRVRLRLWTIAVFVTILAFFTAFDIWSERREMRRADTSQANVLLSHLAGMPEFRDSSVVAVHTSRAPRGAPTKRRRSRAARIPRGAFESPAEHEPTGRPRLPLGRSPRRRLRASLHRRSRSLSRGDPSIHRHSRDSRLARARRPHRRLRVDSATPSRRTASRHLLPDSPDASRRLGSDSSDYRSRARRSGARRSGLGPVLEAQVHRVDSTPNDA